MSQERNSVTLQLTDTTNPYAICDRCGQQILPQDSPEHVIFKTFNSDLRFHTDPCLEEFMEAMAEFFRVFVVEKKKIVKPGAFN